MYQRTITYLLLLFFSAPFSNANESEVITSEKLLERSKELSRLKQEIENIKKQYHKGPRHKSFNSSSFSNASPKFKKYINNWVKKIELIGNLNYPSSALEIKKAANVLVDVAINSDGSVHKIKILKSSGYLELDKSVISLVNLAAPFSVFPEEIKRETDVIHITRKWHFNPKSQTDKSVRSKD